jgi:hypothetical protein
MTAFFVPSIPDFEQPAQKRKAARWRVENHAALAEEETKLFLGSPASSRPFATTPLYSIIRPRYDVKQSLCQRPESDRRATNSRSAYPLLRPWRYQKRGCQTLNMVLALPALCRPLQLNPANLRGKRIKMRHC